MELISKQAAIDAIRTVIGDNRSISVCEAVKQLPPIQPEIIYCKDCEKHNKGVGDFEITPDGKRTWIWKDRACPLVSWRGKAQGHEFDYQFCVYGKKREVTT